MISQPILRSRSKESSPMNEGSYLLPIVYHKLQEEVLYGSSARFKVIAKGRRWGLTTAFAHYVIDKLVGDSVSPILWVDTIYSNIERYFERYFLPVLRHLPADAWKWREVKKELNVLGRICDFRSADNPENIEGFGYALIILNEAGIILRNSYLWHNSIRPMVLDHQAPILIGGTPKGRGIFYEIFQKAKVTKGWQAFQFSSYENPYLSKKEIDELTASMPEKVKQQEIYAQFLEESRLVFRDFENCIKGKEEEPQAGKTYFGGLDLGKHEDWTVLTIMDSSHVVFQKRIQKLSWNFIKEWIKEHSTRYYTPKTLVDATGLGDPIFDDLFKAGLNVFPYIFTPESKARLIERLMLDIEVGEISFPRIEALIAELCMFEYTEVPSGRGGRYSGASGFHDDCVISLALANWARQTYSSGVYVAGYDAV
ncbi:TPA: phosphatase [bacterium]|nr:phosphatase [bacterium]